jgi:hypothetical protein
MKKLLIAAGTASTLALAACGGAEEAPNNVTAVDDLNIITEVPADELGTDANLGTGFNATGDLNVVDVNEAAEAEAVDVNAAVNAQ